MGKIKKNKPQRKERAPAVPVDENPPLPTSRSSDAPVPKKTKWTNRQRVLVFAARGINHRDRHLMRDIRTLMPHHRPDSKMERTKTLSVINELCTMKHCNKAILLEGRRKQDLYMWCSNVPDGPSAKFYIENVHTLGELKMTGNCLRGARPLLSFDQSFTDIPYLALLKELLVQIFGVPNYHPKSQPFYDHIYTFSVVDKRIWFRNFQILSEDGGLAEVGPRFVMNPVKIFEGSFGGEALWENPDYVSPSKYRQMLKKKAKDRYVNRIEQKVNYQLTKPKTSYKLNETDEVFGGDAMEKAAELHAKDKAVDAHMAIENTNGNDINDYNNDDDGGDGIKRKKDKQNLLKVKKLIKHKKNQHNKQQLQTGKKQLKKVKKHSGQMKNAAFQGQKSKKGIKK